MDPTIIASIIAVFTPVITGLIKRFIPYEHERTFKKVIPVVPPLIGAVLGYAGKQIGVQITPEVNNAITGLFLGAMSSTGYDAIKAQKKR